MEDLCDFFLLVFSSLGVDWELFMSRLIGLHDNILNIDMKHLG